MSFEPLTKEQVRKPMGGSIHYVIRNAAFQDANRERCDRKVVELWRSNHDEKEHRFATVYLHECGEVALSIDKRCCVRMQTMLDHVLPVMDNFEKLCSHIPEGQVSDPACGAAVVCTDGGCAKCRGGASAPIIAEITEFLQKCFRENYPQEVALTEDQQRDILDLQRKAVARDGRRELAKKAFKGVKAKKPRKVAKARRS